MRRVTQQEIANRCGVSRAAVSFALRHAPQICETTAAQIRAVAAEMGYQPEHHKAARRMILQRYGRKLINRVVLVFVPRYYHKALYYSRMVEGILDTLTEADFSLVLSYLPVTREERPAALPPLVASGEFDGAIFLALRPEAHAVLDDLRKAAGDADLPFISLAYATTACPSLVFDDEHGAYVSTRHLLELGHRHILQCFNGPVHESFDFFAARIAGARRAMVEFGLSPDVFLHHGGWYLGNLMPEHHLIPADAQGEQNFDAATAEFMQYMRAHPEITAVLAQNDMLAHRIAYHLRKAGNRVPEDISLVGYDDTEPIFLDAHGNNALTTVRVPLAEMGQAAARKALHRIHHPEEAVEDTTVLSPMLVVRQSTAVVRTTPALK